MTKDPTTLLFSCLLVCAVLAFGAGAGYIYGSQDAAKARLDSRCQTWCEVNRSKIGYLEYLACNDSCDGWRR